MDIPTTTDVVIVGAGVVGCSTAYHLARLGIQDVVVVEMDRVGSGSSSRSAAMLSLQFCTTEWSARMARYSYARYMEFEDELGVPIDFRRIGWLTLAAPAQAEELRQNARLLQSLGIPTELLTPEEIQHRYPEIHVADVALGAWGPDDGPFDPHMILSGYVKRARQLGVRLYEGVRATGVRVEAGRVAGVETTRGFVAADVVVNAGGPWAMEIGRWAGAAIPLCNRARTIVVTGPFPPIPSDRPFVEDLAGEWYYRPEGPGVLLGMGDQPTADLNPPFCQDMAEALVDAAMHRVPVLSEATLQTGWTGVRPLTPDGRPILGPAPGVTGLALNCGWGGTGIIQAPIAGQLVAEYVAHGRATTVDIAPFQLDRFAKPGEADTARCQRNVAPITPDKPDQAGESLP